MIALDKNGQEIEPVALDGLPAAGRFVELLAVQKDAQVCWRVLNDGPSDTGARKLHGSLSDHVGVFREAQKTGCAPFIVVNEGGHPGDDITRIRAVFVDSDGQDWDRAEWHIPPDFSVYRDSCHWHAYWLVDNLPPEKFTEVQKRLATHYQTDKSVSNLSRVMRVPGFLHQKDPDNPIEIQLWDPNPGSCRADLVRNWEDVVEGLPELPVPSRSTSKASGSPIALAEFRTILSFIDPTFDGDLDPVSGIEMGQNLWAGMACAVRWGQLPVIEEGVLWERLLDEWCSGELWRKRTGDDYFLVPTYSGFDELMGRTSGMPREHGHMVGLATFIKLAQSNGYKSPRKQVGFAPDDDTGCASDPNEEAKALLRARDAAVDEINHTYSMIVGGSNAGKIADLSDPRDPSLLAKDRMANVLANEQLQYWEGDKRRHVPKSKIWMESKLRRDITDIVFEPPGSKFEASEGAHNLWQGFAVEPKAGSAHQRLVDHLMVNVCDEDWRLIPFLLGWLADLIQRPGDKPGIAVALRGPQGAGKTIVFEYLRKILGDHAMPISRPEHLTGRFNAHMASLCLLGVEEAFWAGDKAAESVLKDLITGREVTVEKKYADPYVLHNHVRLLVTSNEHWVVPAGQGDRRWALFDVNPIRKDDKSYWKPIYEDLHGDGPANLLNFLQHCEYDKEELFRPPMTGAKAEQLIRSFPPAARWWLEVILGERSPDSSSSSATGDPDLVFGGEIGKDTLVRDYRQWCEDAGRKPEDPSQFWKTLREMVGSGYSESRPNIPGSNSRPRMAVFPSCQECQESFGEWAGCDWSEFNTGSISDGD